MTEIKHSSDHEHINLLLPWFVNNTLTDTERDLVRSHLVDCDECREHVSLLATVQSSVSNGSPTPIVPTADVATLFEAIDSEKTVQHTRPASRRFIAIAASIAAAVVVIAMIMVNQNQTPQLPTRFQTATSDDQVTPMDYVLDIQFSNGSTAGAREQVLRDINAKNAASASGDLTYRITVSLQLKTLGDLERYTQKVESLLPVQSVEVIAMQLPVTTPE